MSPEAAPLAGRSVLVTRPRDRAGGLVAALEALGARAVARPTIALVPPLDTAAPRRALERLDGYDWLLFTSPTGVRFFCDAADRLAGSARQIAPRIAVVGRGTAAALNARGHSATLVAERSRAEGLAAALARRLAPGSRVLLVRPEVMRPVLLDALRDTGAVVDDVIFYRNVAAPGVGALAGEVVAGRFDVAVFTSPSTLHRLLQAARRLDLDVATALGRAVLVAIGEVTATAAREAGLRVSAVADEPSDDSIARAVVRAVVGR